MFRLVIFSCLFMAKFTDSKNLPKPTHGKIVGGHDTDITEVPYQVSVHHNESYVCGGSIIGTKHILTAAHCVEDEDENLFSVRAGSNYHYKDGLVVDVVKVITHPNYNTTTVDCDAAILVLKEPLTLSEKVQTVALSKKQPRKGNMVLISGWGSIGEGEDAASFLQSVSVPVVSKTACNEMYGGGDAITDQMFCAGYPEGGKDACLGDSGGPAVVKSKLAGIVSGGEECGDENSPGVYTSVTSILNWITAQIQA